VINDQTLSPVTCAQLCGQRQLKRSEARRLGSFREAFLALPTDLLHSSQGLPFP